MNVKKVLVELMSDQKQGKIQSWYYEVPNIVVLFWTFSAILQSLFFLYAGLVQTRKLSNYVKRKQDVNLEKFKAGVMECPILWSFLDVIKQNARKGR